MPMLDAGCDECDHQFEVERAVSEPTLSEKKAACPICKSKKTRQLFLKPPAYHNLYSPMHPRKNRGRGF